MTARPQIPKWKRARKAVREPVWALADIAARPTAGRRVLPDYLIIGAQRAGTTSLQEVLTAHPNVSSARWRKGVHYFDTSYPRGIEWYRSQFPTKRTVQRVAQDTGTPLRVGEASPYYIFHPVALDRIANDLPTTKLILLLRDPVQRTISHHKHETRRGNETLSLEAALAAEAERLAGEPERVAADPSYNSFNLQTYSYVARSRYAPQVRKLLDLFAKDRVLILPSERFFDHPAATYAQILDFLEVPEFQPASYPRMNATKSDDIPEPVLEELRASFRDVNEELFSLVGERYPWP